MSHCESVIGEASLPECLILPLYCSSDSDSCISEYTGGFLLRSIRSTRVPHRGEPTEEVLEFTELALCTGRRNCTGASLRSAIGRESRGNSSRSSKIGSGGIIDSVMAALIESLVPVWSLMTHLVHTRKPKEFRSQLEAGEEETRAGHS
jgi:hypothetical protein